MCPAQGATLGATWSHILLKALTGLVGSFAGTPRNQHWRMRHFILHMPMRNVVCVWRKGRDVMLAAQRLQGCDPTGVSGSCW